jgi:hypothetical protein
MVLIGRLEIERHISNKNERTRTVDVVRFFWRLSTSTEAKIRLAIAVGRT